MLDEDNIRHGLCGDLGFSYEDRKENLRRIGEVSKLFVEVGVVVLAAFISPFREERRNVRDIIGCDDFVEIYVDCSSEVCESRDVKGLYKKAKSGKIKDFTGISSPYEQPKNPVLIVNTDKESLEDSVNKIVNLLNDRGYL